MVFIPLINRGSADFLIKRYLSFTMIAGHINKTGSDKKGTCRAT